MLLDLHAGQGYAIGIRPVDVDRVMRRCNADGLSLDADAEGLVDTLFCHAAGTVTLWNRSTVSPAILAAVQ